MNEDELIQGFLSTGTEPQEILVYLHQVLDLLKLNHHCTSSETKKISPKYSKYLYITIGYENFVKGG